MENKIKFNQWMGISILAFLVGVFIGFKLPTPVGNRVIFQNRYVAAAISINTGAGPVQLGCQRDTTYVEVRQDSVKLRVRDQGVRFQTIRIDNEKGLYYCIRPDGVVVRLKRIKRAHMPAGKEFELMRIDQPEAEILLNANETCPPERINPDAIQVR